MKLAHAVLLRLLIYIILSVLILALFLLVPGLNWLPNAAKVPVLPSMYAQLMAEGKITELITRSAFIFGIAFVGLLFLFGVPSTSPKK